MNNTKYIIHIITFTLSFIIITHNIINHITVTSGAVGSRLTVIYMCFVHKFFKKSKKFNRNLHFAKEKKFKKKGKMRKNAIKETK